MLKKIAGAVLVWVLFGVWLAVSSQPAYGVEPFTKRDWAMQWTYTAVHVMDWGQTRNIKRHPTMYEKNPLLGKNPSDGRIDRYMAATLMGHWAVTYLLPAKYRPYWQGLTIAVEAGTVVNNYDIGLSMEF